MKISKLTYQNGDKKLYVAWDGETTPAKLDIALKSIKQELGMKS
jgi:hypothetical protein